MAPNPGRGAQVRLDGDAQKIARGAGAARLIDSLEAKAALERAGVSANGYTPDGSTLTGGIAEDEALTPGGVVPTTGDVTAIATTAANTAAEAKVTELAVPKAGGTLTGPLVLSGAATTDLQATTKKQVDDIRLTIPTYPSRAWITTNTIPAAVTQFLTDGYYIGGDAGGARWLRVASGSALIPLFAITTNRALVNDASGALFVMVDKVVSLRQFGAQGTAANGTTIIDDSLAADHLWDFVTAVRPYNSNEYVSTAQIAPRAQPAIRFEADRFRLWTAKAWESVPNVGISIFGNAAGTQLDGLSIGIRAFRVKMRDLVLHDIRGIQADSQGIYGDLVRHADIAGVTVRDKHIGLNLTGGGTSELARIVVEKCNIGWLADGAGDQQVTNLRATGNFYYGMIVRDSAELKLSNSALSGSAVAQLLIEGDNAKACVENYFSHLTSTGGIAGGMASSATTDADLLEAIKKGDDMSRTFLACPVSNNGAGKVRVTTSPLRNITSIAAKTGIYFSRGSDMNRAEAHFTLAGANPVTSITADGTELLAGSVAYAGSASAMHIAVAAAINANTTATGFVARTQENNNGRVYVYQKRSLSRDYNGKVLVVTTASTVTTSSIIEITTDVAHGYTMNHPVHIEAGTNYTGTEPVMFASSPTTFVIRAPFNGTATGTVCIPNRMASGAPDVFFDLGAGTYTGKYTTIACGPNWIDIGLLNTTTAVNFTTADTVRVKLMSWDTIIRARDICSNVNDMFFDTGNQNYVLIETGFNITFMNVRVKAHAWIDKRIDPLMQASQITDIRSGRSRSGNGVTPFYWAGANVGWQMVISGDDGTTPSNSKSYVSMVAPDATTPIVNGRARVNLAALKPAGFEVTIAGRLRKENAIGSVPTRVAFSELAALAPEEGTQVQVTDRANRIATRTGSTWTDQTGAVMT